jgi:phage protein D
MLLIEAKDKAIQLTGARKSNYYSNQKDSDVITILGSAFSPQVDSTNTTYPQLVQFDCTDWDFLLTRAEANSMLVLTDDNNLIVKTRHFCTANFCRYVWG